MASCCRSERVFIRAHHFSRRRVSSSLDCCRVQEEPEHFWCCRPQVPRSSKYLHSGQSSKEKLIRGLDLSMLRWDALMICCSLKIIKTAYSQPDLRLLRLHAVCNSIISKEAYLPQRHFFTKNGRGSLCCFLMTVGGKRSCFSEKLLKIHKSRPLFLSYPPPSVLWSCISQGL